MKITVQEIGVSFVVTVYAFKLLNVEINITAKELGVPFVARVWIHA